MNNVVKDEEKNTPLYQALMNLPIDNICHSEYDRPINDNKYPLWSDGDTVDAFATTTAAWDIFKPVNG